MVVCRLSINITPQYSLMTHYRSVWQYAEILNVPVYSYYFALDISRAFCSGLISSSTMQVVRLVKKTCQ